jgi:hypothetical protein
MAALRAAIGEGRLDNMADDFTRRQAEGDLPPVD